MSLSNFEYEIIHPANVPNGRANRSQLGKLYADKIKKSEKGLKKGPRARGKQLIQTAKQNKKILLAQAKVLKQQNPNINRKMIAFKLSEFSKNFVLIIDIKHCYFQLW